MFRFLAYSVLTSDKSYHRGSVLWFVLICIILLGALSLTITRSGSKVNQTGDYEQLQTEAGSIVRTAKGIERAVENMRTQGVSENDFCFDDPLWGHNDYNHSACATASNKIFNTASGVYGGGINFPQANESWFDPAFDANVFSGAWLFTAYDCVHDVGSGASCSGSGDNPSLELLAILPFIRKDLCVAINKIVGVTNPSGNPPVDASSFLPATVAAAAFQGVYSFGDNIGDNTNLDTHGSGCFQAGGGTNSPSGSYHFYHTLIAR